jgi:hypothetical protein
MAQRPGFGSGAYIIVMIVALFIKSRITDFELHLRHHDIGDFTYSTDMKNFLSYLFSIILVSYDVAVG